MKLFFLILFTFLTATSFAQDSAKMKIITGSENEDLQHIISFEGMALHNFEFSGKKLAGKDYEFNVKEFKNGKLINTTMIIDSKEAHIFKIKKDSFKFKMLTKTTEDNKFKIELSFGHFTSRKLTCNLYDKNGTYIMKTFLGQKNEINVPINGHFYITALITPTMHKDGSSSYCEVAQSGIDPEKLNEKYIIPHYFLIEMTLK